MKLQRTRQRETKTLKFTANVPAATAFSVDLPRTFDNGEPIAAQVPTEIRVASESDGTVTIWLDVLMVAPA
jgi:hypothetical protein